MKNYRFLFIMMAAVMFAVSCSEEDASVEDLSSKKATFYDTDRWDAIDFCGPVRYHDLIGGQTILMGSVAIGNTADTLYVKYQADPGYVITETHLFVGDVMDGDFPKTKKGNPKIGHFPYASEKLDGSTVVVYSIPLSKIEGDCFDVAAHAVVECEDGTCEETAWGAGSQEGEVVFAAKLTLDLGVDWDLGLTQGVLFSEDCSWGPNFGYVTLNLEDFIPGSYDLISPQNVLYGTLNTSINSDTLVFSYEAIPDLLIERQWLYVFAGTADELYSKISNDNNCVDYTSFYQTFQNNVVKIPISEISTSSSTEAMEFESARWGFYFDFCVSKCN